MERHELAEITVRNSADGRMPRKTGIELVTQNRMQDFGYLMSLDRISPMPIQRFSHHQNMCQQRPDETANSMQPSESMAVPGAVSYMDSMLFGENPEKGSLPPCERQLCAEKKKCVFLAEGLDFLFFGDYIAFGFRTIKTNLFTFTLTRQMKGLPA